MSFNDFAINLYKRASKCKEGNFVLGPGSIYSALALVMAGAKGETQEEILRSMGLPTSGFHEHCAKTIQGLMQGAGSAKMFTSNRVYADNGAKILPSYLDTVARHYSADAVNVDFKKAPNAQRLAINAWVADKTMEKIQDLLSEGSVTTDTFAVLVNAMYFRGQWNQFFKPSSTRPGQFHLSSGGTKEVKLMGKRETVPYFESKEHSFRAITMPFKESKLKFAVILPDEVNGLQEILKKDNILDLLTQHNFNHTDIDISLPKFKVEGNTVLKEVLNDMGIKAAFDGVMANFKEMSQDPIFFSEGFHKAFVEVDEEGAEAAAATAMVAMIRCAGRPEKPRPSFIVDRPFLFAILSENDQPIFMGHVTDPSS